MTFTTQCPQCGKILWFSGQIAGTVTLCPACGGEMLLVAPEGENLPQPAAVEPGDAPVESDAEPMEPEQAEQIGVVAQNTMPPQPPEPAMAIGEIQVEADVESEESDIVHWTVQPQAQGEAIPVAVSEINPQPVAPAPSQPPVWAPPPLSQLGDLVQPSYLRNRPSAPPPPRAVRQPGQAKSIFLWAAGVAAVIVVLVSIMWLIGRGSGNNAGWEQAHRQEILGLKQDAERLALTGQYREAYQKYQDLERLVEGQAIEDPYLQSELERAWARRDALYELAMTVHPAPQPTPQAHDTTAVENPPAPANDNQPPQPPVTRPSSLATPDVIPQTQPAMVENIPGPEIPPRPAVHAMATAAPALTDEQIGDAIKKGTDFLAAQFDGAQLPQAAQYHDGLDCLAVYALMQANLATHDRRFDIHGPFMINAIEAMKKLPMRDNYQTYARALRATALALNDRPEDHWVIRQDVNWLLNAQAGGAFTYTGDFPRNTDFFWDNSNSQYGLLGVWAGAEVGIQVPADFWRLVRNHWGHQQTTDGRWCYTNIIGNNTPLPTTSMTLAGIASLLVAQDYLDPTEFGDQVGRAPFSPALTKGLDWLDQGDNSFLDLDGDYWSYTLYGLERVGLASGFKYFGTHDWYRELAGELIKKQQDRGSWGTADPFLSIIDTSYTLLFLARGRHPIVMNKLRFEDDWANRPRDVANLARFATTELERPLNWQIVPISRDWHDWTDSPILYMADNRPPNLTDEDKQKLKQYIENGGLLLTQADGGSAPFSQWVEDLGKQLFPQYGWTDLPDDSSLWNVSYHLTAHPKMRVITNGSRILMLHWPEDITHFWQLRLSKDGRSSFELGVNLILYGAGKSELRNRLASDYIPEAATPAAGSIRLARLRYDGNWDPEPQAWDRANRWFRRQTDLGLAIEPTALEDLASSRPPIAHLTGTAHFTPTDAQIQAVRSYVQGGGVLIIDPCGLPGDFLTDARDYLLAKAFPGEKIDPLDASSPLLLPTGNGMEDVSTPLVRAFVRTLADTPDSRVQMLKSGKGHVIILPLDLTSGLLGTDAWGIAGYRPDYSLSLLKNIVLWAWDGARDTQ